jgi:hypothetical protein
MGLSLDFPRDKLLALARQYVELVMPLVREQERLIDQSRSEAVEHPLTKRVLETIGTASNAVVAYESLVKVSFESSKGAVIHSSGGHFSSNRRLYSVSARP